MQTFFSISIVTVLASSADAFTIQAQSDKGILLPKTLLFASGQAPGVDDPSLIRNVALVGHSHSGKTTLAEWMLYDEHQLDKKPTVGESALDFDPVEAHRHSSLFSHFMRVPHKSHLLEVADTPFGDFPTDAFSALDGADCAILVVSDEISSSTLNTFEHCTENGIKTLVALNKMDKPHLNTNDILGSMRESFNVNVVPIQVYNGEGSEFKEVESLLLLDDKGIVTRNQAKHLDNAWENLAETVATLDDELLVEYLENGEVEDGKIIAGLKKAVLEQKILPVVYTSAINDIGVSELMDTVIALLPDPIVSREYTLRLAHETVGDDTDSKPGEEGGFAARVVHTSIDSFGSLSVIRVISNSRNQETGRFEPLPSEIINLRTGDKVKLSSTCFGLCGKNRQALAEDAQILPGDVLALPKIPDSVCTNDIICSKMAVVTEEHEKEIESLTKVLSPLSRDIPTISLMATATIALAEGGKGKKGPRQSGSGDDKLINAISALTREDLAMKVEQHAGQWIVHCMSKDHLNLLVERLKDRYNVDVELGDAPVAYRETIMKPIMNVEGKHKKQSGGSGQFGVCYISIEPLDEGTGFEFISAVKGGAISKTFINSVEKGVQEQLQAGGPLGFPVTDIRVTVTDGKMHSVDSKDIAFQMAGRQAVKRALDQAGTILLQPMQKVKFIINDQLQGEVNGIVSRSDGYVIDSIFKESNQAEIDAIIPAAAISEVSEILRAESKGEGSYVAEFSHYQKVSDAQVKTICEKLKP